MRQLEEIVPQRRKLVSSKIIPARPRAMRLSAPSAWRFMWRALAVAISALALLRVSVGVAAWRAAEALERPQYEVLRKVGRGIEIR